MTTSKDSSTLPKLGFDIEDLFRAALARTKDRFLPYIFTMLMAIVIQIALMLGIGLVVGANALIYAITRSNVIVGITGVISAIAAVGVGLYISSWTTLAIVHVMTAAHKLGVGEVFKEVKPLVWKYYWVMLLTGLFFLGLVPVSVFTLFILLFVWCVWGAFTAFTFLEYKEAGLASLWRSKAIVSTKFWGVVLRGLLVYVAYYVVIIGLSVSQGEDGSGLIGVLVFVLGILAGPFLMSYGYEMYRNLEHPKEYGSNTVWKVLSVIGLALIILGAVAGIASAGQNAPELIERMQEMQMEQGKDDMMPAAPVQDGDMPYDYDYDYDAPANDEEITEEELQELMKQFEAGTI